MTDTKLNQKASISAIHKLYQDGLLGEKVFIAASSIVRPRSVWFEWTRRMLLFFGSALVLAGIIFFFAYNWSKMERFFKFGLIEAGILACVITSHLRGINKLSGKVLLLSASVLVGVLMAVYGQTYQTGADAFELFVGWAILILGWVLISDFSALWIVWLILLNTGAILYWKQVGHPAHSIRYEIVCLSVAFLNGIALVLYEVGLKWKFDWLRGRWLRSVLLAGSLVALSIPPIGMIVDPVGKEGITILVAFGWCIAAAGGYGCYRYKLHDMIPLAIIISNVCVILLTFIGKLLFHETRYGEAGLFLLFSLMILAVVSGAVFLLRKTAAKMASEVEKVDDE